MKKTSKRQGLSFWEMWDDYQWLLLGFLTVIAMVLGITGFIQMAALSEASLHVSTISDALYQTLLLFTFEGVATNHVPLSLDISRWLTVCVAGFAVVKTFLTITRKEYGIFRLLFCRDHIVICGLGRKGTLLIEDLLSSTERKNRHITVIELNNDNDQLVSYRKKGITIIQGSATDPITLQKAGISKAAYLFILTNNDDTNIEIAFKAFQTVTSYAVNEIMPKVKDGIISSRDLRKRKSNLKCYAHVSNSIMFDLFRQHKLFNHNHRSFEGKLFNLYEASSRQVFNQYPPDELCGGLCHLPDSAPIHIVIVGFVTIGRTLLLHILRQAHYGNLKRTRITIIDSAADIESSRFRGAYPGVEQVAEVHFLSKDPQSLNMHDILQLNDICPVPILYISLDDDTLTYLTAYRLAAQINHVGDAPVNGLQIVACIPEITPLYPLMKGKEQLTTYDSGLQLPDQMQIFHMISESCNWKVIVQEDLDEHAEKLHQDYLNTRTELTSEEISMSWDELSEEYRNSNRYAADHYSIKQRAILAAFQNLRDKEKGLQPPFVDDNLVERLARMEHQRWTAEKLLSGWTYGPKRDDGKKKNPNLVDWDRLDEQVKLYNLENARKLFRR
ncbi:hypothetical protein GJ688_07635 [Heliobacillus mobilis]|uniref:RCK N-terminal domain-containing protein n=1 Tax=Heliobacterium mobile TaxID=28064 RepID=A0A6I3SJD2_HELMO|nr:NAD-binding protein [Heliobacterium mobile]MTV48852.1 hypothetical protein [Heliobacterium mobile]